MEHKCEDSGIVPCELSASGELRSERDELSEPSSCTNLRSRALYISFVEEVNLLQDFVMAGTPCRGIKVVFHTSAVTGCFA